jgi:hypothetical protein
MRDGASMVAGRFSRQRMLCCDFRFSLGDILARNRVTHIQHLSRKLLIVDR